jgi:PIN domain nuclease of toxin-antitoxin system
MHHRDPFDRMLIAQAQLESCSIVSRDSSFAQYSVALIMA